MLNFGKPELALFLCLAALLLSDGVSRADVLSGHVEKKEDSSGDEKNSFDAGRLDDSRRDPISGYSNPSVDDRKSEFRGDPDSQNSQQGQPIRYPDIGIPQNSFPFSFLGRWNCVTEVVNSAVKDVAVGSKMVSEVKFARGVDGRVAAKWVQPGWIESQAYAVSWSKIEARVDRTCYYFADGVEGAWASRSRDHFLMKSPNKMICKSYIDQYIDGRYLGRYRTVSILTRM